MGLVYGFIPLVILIAAGLLIKLTCDWLDRRHFAKQSGKEAAAAARSSAAGSRLTGEKPHRPASLGHAEFKPEPASTFSKATPVHRLARIRASQDGEGVSAGGAPPTPPPAVPPAKQPQISESVTAVLRRQVPVRGEAPRSWLGGLPMMPEGVEWPRGVNPEYPDQGEVPLHFLAQIACEDLPKDLWGGVGPRNGWLLFFINPNNCDASGEGTRQVIHTTELGEEREPPFDCGPVHDGVYTGGSYAWLNGENVPQFWRRWPVDIVTMANELTVHEEGNHSYKKASPNNLSDVLYADVPLTKTEFSAPMPRMRPMTFGHARNAVQALSAQLRRKVRAPIDDKARELLLAEGGHALLVGELNTTRMKISAINPGERGEHQSRTLVFVERAIDAFGQLNGEQVLARIEERYEELLAWKEGLAKGCEQIDIMLGKSNPNTALSDEYWRQLTETFAGKQFDYFELRHRNYGDDRVPFFLLGPSETVFLAPPKGMDEIAIEYYLDPAKRDLLPEGYAASQEPVWRALESNRPHRMGGYHDGVQSEPIEGNFDQVLLLQIASDRAMDWCWGDVGAYYFWIRPEHLEKRDFSGVEVWLECH